MTPRYVVLDTSTDLVLEARFRGNSYAHDWQFNEDDPTFRTGSTSLFTAATRTNGGQTYTIPAGSASLRVGYYGPEVLPTVISTIDATPENTVIVGSFCKCTITNSVAPLVKTLLVSHVIRVLVVQIYRNSSCICTYKWTTCSGPSDILICSVLYTSLVCTCPSPDHVLLVNVFLSYIVISPTVFAAVAPTAFINGLNTAQVTAAAGDSVTFTCLAHGFPETTLSIQLSGVTASYTIGNQTLMTEATPTSFMEVNRTVTLYNVTALDCRAVVTCVASNMNSDGSTHTDQAAATLQVQGER